MEAREDPASAALGSRGLGGPGRQPARPPASPGEPHLPSPGFTLTRSIASRAWAMRVLGGGFRSDTSWVEPKYLAPNMTPSRRSSWSQGPGTEGNRGGGSAPESPQPCVSNPQALPWVVAPSVVWKHRVPPLA